MVENVCPTCGAKLKGVHAGNLYEYEPAPDFDPMAHPTWRAWKEYEAAHKAWWGSCPKSPAELRWEGVRAEAGLS
jgi:hypothetical protein